MNSLNSSLILPNLDFQYIKDNDVKYFRVVSDKLDPLFHLLINNKKVRVQIWLERQIKKQSNSKIKRSWVHSQDFSSSAPSKLFSEDVYDYGGGDGWGFKANKASYSTNNGYVPTEFEITSEDIINGRIIKMFPVLDVFTNIIKDRETGVAIVNGGQIRNITFISRGRSRYQLLRVKLAVNYYNKALFSIASSPLMLGVHIGEGSTFDATQISDYIKIGNYI